MPCVTEKIITTAGFRQRWANGTLLAVCVMALGAARAAFGLPSCGPPLAGELLGVWYYPYYNLIRVRITPDGMAGVLDESVLQTPNGQPGLLGEYFDFSSDPAKMPELDKLGDEPDLVTVVPSVDFTWWGSRTAHHELPLNDFAARWSGTVGPFPQRVELMIIARRGVRFWLDGEKIIDQWQESRSLAMPDPHYTGVILEPGRTYNLRLEHFKDNQRGMCHLGCRLADEAAKEVRSAQVRLLGPEGQELCRRETQWEGGPHSLEFEVPDLPEGEYTVEARVPGLALPATRRFIRKRYPWEGSRLGVTNHIYPPFEPIAVEGRGAKVVLRRYTVGGLGLWDSVQARGQHDDDNYRELLARPIALVVDGKTRLEGRGEFTTVTDQAVVYEGSAEHPGMKVRTRATTEYDGCMKVEMRIEPGEEDRQIKSLTLEVPLRDAEAPLQHVVRGSRPIRANLAGYTWPGEGKIFESRELPDPGWPSTFRPYFWFGSEARGLCWFADNEKGWVLDLENNPSCQTVHREDGELVLRVHLIQKPMTIEEPREIVFGLMATPAKPVPADVRKHGRRDFKRMAFSMPTFYGMPHSYAAVYPFGRDYTLFDHVQARRLGADADPEYVQNLMAQRYDPEDLTGYRARIGTGCARYRNMTDPLSVYFTEFFATSLYHEETWTFRSEWSGYEIRRQEGIPPFASPWAYAWGLSTPGITRSWRDFATWHAADWLRRGFGLYFDNSFPLGAFDTVATSAFEREDGEVTPSCGIWNRRDLLQRIWVLHQQFYNPETPQVMMIHMTNTHIVPYMVWNQVNLDLEWMRKPPTTAPFQAKFGHDLLRAESTGLQTGVIPTAFACLPKADRHVPQEWLDEHAASYMRVADIALLVHEIKQGIGGSPYPGPLDEFGYGLDDARVFNYWDRQPPVEINDPEAKWLLVEREGNAMLLLCTWNPEPAELRIQLDTERLGFAPKSVSDAEAEQNAEAGAASSRDRLDRDQWNYDPGRAALTMVMPGYGVRILRFR